MLQLEAVQDELEAARLEATRLKVCFSFKAVHPLDLATYDVSSLVSSYLFAGTDGSCRIAVCKFESTR